MNQSQDKVLVFLQQVTPRVGPANAMGLLKDTHLQAFRKLFVELGMTEKHIEEVVESCMNETAQNILKMPVPSPIQRV